MGGKEHLSGRTSILGTLLGMQYILSCTIEFIELRHNIDRFKILNYLNHQFFINEEWAEFSSFGLNRSASFSGLMVRQDRNYYNIFAFIHLQMDSSLRTLRYKVFFNGAEQRSRNRPEFARRPKWRDGINPHTLRSRTRDRLGSNTFWYYARSRVEVRPPPIPPGRRDYFPDSSTSSQRRRRQQRH